MKRPKKNILFILIALLVIAFSIWQVYKYKIANKGIHKLVEQKSKGLYNVHYEHFFIDEVSGSAGAGNIKITADTGVYNQMPKNSRPSMLVNLFFPALKITGVQTPKALLYKEISGKEVSADSPTIEIILNDFLKDTTEYSVSEELYKQILGNLKSISMNSIHINHARLIVKDYASGEKQFEATDVSISLSDLMIDSLHEKDSSRVFFSKNCSINCKEIKLSSKNKKYKFDLEGLEYSSGNDRFTMNRARVIPTLNETDFAKSFPAQKDRYDFSFENISLSGINQKSLSKKRIEATNLRIENSSFKIYRDISYPADTIHRPIKSFPQQQFMRLQIPIAIKEVVLAHSFIEYKEKNGKSDQSGKVQFYNVSASINNLTNIHSLLSDNSVSEVHFKSTFLNKASLTATLNLYLKNPDGKFAIDASMESINATDLNILTQPMALVKIKKGQIDKLNLNITGDNIQSNGKVTILYHGISMSLLKKPEENNYPKKVLPSFILNEVIKSSNPSKGETKTAEVNYQRTGRRSIFNMIWKPILNGVKETIGIK